MWRSKNKKLLKAPHTKISDKQQDSSSYVSENIEKKTHIFSESLFFREYWEEYVHFLWVCGVQKTKSFLRHHTKISDKQQDSSYVSENIKKKTYIFSECGVKDPGLLGHHGNGSLQIQIPYIEFYTSDILINRCKCSFLKHMRDHIHKMQQHVIKYAE